MSKTSAMPLKCNQPRCRLKSRNAAKRINIRKGRVLNSKPRHGKLKSNLSSQASRREEKTSTASNRVMNQGRCSNTSLEKFLKFFLIQSLAVLFPSQAERLGWVFDWIEKLVFG